MTSERLGRTLAYGVMAVAVFNTLAALSLPVRERKPALAIVLLWLALLVAHAIVYWFGDRVRARIGMLGYLGAQVVLIFGLGVSGALYPIGVALFAVLTAETVLLAGERWGSVPITVGAIFLFGATAIAASDLYRGATAGLILAITGVIAHAAAALLGRRPALAAVMHPSPSPVPTAAENGVAELTPREQEVLRALTSGARSSEIAKSLGITERTVKAHL